MSNGPVLVPAAVLKFVSAFHEQCRYLQGFQRRWQSGERGTRHSYIDVGAKVGHQVSADPAVASERFQGQSRALDGPQGDHDLAVRRDGNWTVFGRDFGHTQPADIW